jgi:transcriptional regulator with XRE-family HTH domain
LNSVERVKEICKNRKIPISKLEKELGFSNGYISQLRKGVFPADRLEKISNFLGVTTTYLMTGEENSEKSLTPKDEKDIEKILEQTREQLMNQEGLMFDGDPASPEAIDSILSAMQIGMELAKKKNKEKYTPKKYKKD